MFMVEKISGWCGKIIEWSFYLLFFFVPLILTPLNYELFEYNKMMMVYGFALVIGASWIIKMIANGKPVIRRTPLDIPILLFLLSQIISTIFSIDRHVSIFGYYSRFNGGLLSVISYITLYYAFVTNFPQDKIKKLMFWVLSSGFLVSVYGILEHFGIDKNIWVQDVQNRVFSTLGQPNWLAAYISVLLPISLGLGIITFRSSEDRAVESQKSKVKSQNYNSKVKSSFFKEKIGLSGYWVVGSIYYLTLLYTKSRSGFIGFWVADVILIALTFIISYIKSKNVCTNDVTIVTGNVQGRSGILGKIVLANILFLVITFFIGSPFTEFNKYTFPELTRNKSVTAEVVKPPSGTALETGGTESGEIRRIVWKGAIDIIKHYPIFGTGVETFAFAYYKFRPLEHNAVSEWDFLYNKAHNEYLNYGATTGLVGLGSYLLFILFFIIWNLNKVKNQKLKFKNSNQKLKVEEDAHNSLFIIHSSLFSGWLTILITNFFGFSVVIIQLLFFLIPAIIIVLDSAIYPSNHLTIQTKRPVNSYQMAGIILTFFAFSFLIFTLCKFWYADTLFAKGYNLNRAGDAVTANPLLRNAVMLNNNEPVYHDELSVDYAQLAVLAYDQKNATLSAELAQSALEENNKTLSISSQNVTFWKSRTRIFYALSSIDNKYLKAAVDSLLIAEKLAPTDPKITYNLGLLYMKLNEKEKGLDFLLKSAQMKTNYKDPYFALGLFYMEEGKKEEGKKAFEHILKYISPDDVEVKKQLEEIGN
ncbi:MAG: hypothetical protein UT63_C0008G0001 [Candidatus Gottesmanbacteria bacterium GW2011_GWC2_39_8]|uniref:O-antigen ligase-related domain-containing protein n=1 Tax=Candidatus Gottesmanbacteria bacterium GW2011_GWC2_39_8 TaxID=1618450 RepID=A0A0G0T7Y2_9BACT|nr:MAG: hypothetical protein UT63_C0008G0001 [Candidatus Gottesmanbacteria bacterium GW2011_GWC2_39_8]